MKVKAPLRLTLLSVRDLLVTSAPFIVIAVVLLALAYVWLKPNPPRHVVLATGPDQGAYAEFGKRYAAELKRYGIEVKLRSTGGATENLRLLKDPKEDVDLAFVQGGASEALHASDEQNDGIELQSLGGLFYEPVWIFYREDAARKVLGPGKRGLEPAPVLTELSQFKTLRINAGARGSGTGNLMRKVLYANGIDRDTLNLSRLEPTPAVVALLEGEVDAVMFVSAPESPLIQMLLMTPGIRLFDFVQNEAYARRFAFLTALTLPRGVVDLAKDVPPTDVHLVAATSTLVTRSTTHPAILQLFVQTAQRVHGGTGWFARAGQFPVGQDPERPLASEAARFYRNGAPVLQRYLPFGIANLIDRMWVALVSIIAVLIPLSRLVPPIYQFRIRSRVFRWYGRLRRIEEAAAAGSVAPVKLIEELDEIETRVERVTVPLSHADELYALRGHIDMVRDRLRTSARNTSEIPDRSPAIDPSAAQ
ncbi:MAG TPA: TAXI family TRAP transporter solute-binding subunit [Burkholderiaceae bacterium]|nr:TAXI family TRAP transporter solute-binding subunit [Burkholderiaceae bacterium]